MPPQAARAASGESRTRPARHCHCIGLGRMPRAAPCRPASPDRCPPPGATLPFFAKYSPFAAMLGFA
jgi:hypothetical protein